MLQVDRRLQKDYEFWYNEGLNPLISLMWLCPWGVLWLMQLVVGRSGTIAHDTWFASKGFYEQTYVAEDSVIIYWVILTGKEGRWHHKKITDSGTRPAD